MKKTARAFTLTELMITVAIMAIVAVAGGMSINSRIRTANLESAAQQLVSDISSMRSSAMYKGCAVRLVFCPDVTCHTSVPPVVNGTSGLIKDASGNAAVYYAMLRMSTDPADGTITSGCPNSNFVASSADGYGKWDFDRKPQKIPKGLAFKNIYADLNNMQSVDWWDSTATNANKSFYFRSSDGQDSLSTAVTTNPLDGSGNRIAVQLQFEDCTSECSGYFVSVGSGGDVQMVKCGGGSRSNSSNVCF